MRLFLFLIFGSIFYSCGTSVGIDYDKEVEFKNYTTYNFYPTLETGLSELDENRIIKITDSLLQEKGFVKSNDPQLLINFYSKEHVSRSRNTIGIGLGSVGRGSSVGVSTGIPVGGNEINQELTVDFIDTARDALVWQAKSDGNYKEKATPKHKISYYQSTLTKIFNKFPPKS